MSKETIEDLDRKIVTLQRRRDVLASAQSQLDNCEEAERRLGNNADYLLYGGGNGKPRLLIMEHGLSKKDSVSIDMDMSEKTEMEKLVSAMLTREQERAKRGLEFFSKAQMTA